MASAGNDDQKAVPSSVKLSDWERRLNAFTLKFIERFRSKLNVYKNDAGPGIKTDNKEFNKFKTEGEFVVEVASLINGLLGWGVKAGITIFDAIAGAHGNNTHTNKAKNISKIFREIDEDILKLILIAACGDIYFSFQNQFTKITDRKTNDDFLGMEKLANDAVNRTFDYISKHEKVDYREAELPHFITKGVIFGESKREPNKNILEKPGHTLKKKNTHEIWYTPEIFENVFILMNFDNNIFVQFIREGKGQKEEDGKYGCRYPFEWEINGFDSKLKSNKLENCKKVTNKITQEKFKLTKEVILEHLKTLYERIFDNYVMSKQIDNIEEYLKNLNLEDFQDNIIESVRELLEKMKIDLNSGNQTRDKIICDTFSNFEEKVKNNLHKEEITELLKQIKNMLEHLTRSTKIENKKVWFNITEPVALFTGRTYEITRIHELIKSKSTQSVVIQAATISGLGGIGKTELARMYIEKYKKEYYNGIWIDSETYESLKESFINLSIEIGLPTTKLSQDGKSNEEIDIKIIVKNIYEFIGKSLSLVIFDNAESYKDIKYFLPASLHPEYQKPYILFTSRNTNWNLVEEGDTGMINLDVFSIKDAFDFIEKSIKGIDVTDEEINELGDKLGLLPLALAQAVSYIKNENKRQRKNNTYGIREYLNEFLTKFPKFIINEDRYQHTIMTTWNITFKKISQDSNALKIIQTMSLLSPDCKEFFNICITFVQKEKKVWDAIELLEKYSLISYDRKTDTASIHRLLQVVVNDQKRAINK